MANQVKEISTVEGCNEKWYAMMRGISVVMSSPQPFLDTSKLNHRHIPDC